MKYLMAFSNGTTVYDFSRLVLTKDKTKLTEAGCSSSLKSASGNLAFIIRPTSNEADYTLRAEILSKIADAKTLNSTVIIRLYEDDGTTLAFTGKLDLSSISESSAKVPSDISLTAYDASWPLDKKIEASFEWPTYPDPNNAFATDPFPSDAGLPVFSLTVESVVGNLLQLAGFGLPYGTDANTENYDYNSDNITRIVRDITYDKDEASSTYRDVIDKLLYESCATIHFTPDGKITVRSLKMTYVQETLPAIHYIYSDGISTSGSIYEYDGLKVKYSSLKSNTEASGASAKGIDVKTKKTLYVEDLDATEDSNGNILGTEVPSNTYLPTTGDIEEVYQDFKSDFLDLKYLTKESRLKDSDLSIISARNVSAEFISDNNSAFTQPIVGTMTSNPMIYPKKARYLFYNTDSASHYIKAFRIYGDVLYRDKIKYMTCPDGCNNPEDYDSTYIFNDTDAQAFASWYTDWKRNLSFGTHTWNELTERNVFDIVKVQHSMETKGYCALIINKTTSWLNGNTKKFEYTAITIDSYTTKLVSVWSKVAGASSIKGDDGMDGNGIASMVQHFQVSTDNVTAPTEWDTDITLTATNKYLWSYTVTTYTDGQVITSASMVVGVYGDTGTPATGFTLSADKQTYKLNERKAAPTAQEIAFTCNEYNIDATPTWSLTANIDDVPILINTAEKETLHKIKIATNGIYATVTISQSCTVTSFVVTCEVSGFDSQTCTISAMDTGTAEVMYWGSYPQTDTSGAIVNLPTGTDLIPLIDGDYFLWQGTPDTDKDYTTIDGVKYYVNATYVYSGASWVVADKNTVGYSEMVLACLTDVLNSASTISEKSICKLWVNELIANNITANAIGTLSLHMLGDGTIYGGGYSENGTSDGTPGIYIDAKGKVLAKGMTVDSMTAHNITADGTLELKRTSDNATVFKNTLTVASTRLPASGTYAKENRFWKIRDMGLPVGSLQKQSLNHNGASGDRYYISPVDAFGSSFLNLDSDLYNGSVTDEAYSTQILHENNKTGNSSYSTVTRYKKTITATAAFTATCQVALSVTSGRLYIPYEEMYGGYEHTTVYDVAQGITISVNGTKVLASTDTTTKSFNVNQGDVVTFYMSTIYQKTLSLSMTLCRWVKSDSLSLIYPTYTETLDLDSYRSQSDSLTLGQSSSSSFIYYWFPYVSGSWPDAGVYKCTSGEVTIGDAPHTLTRLTTNGSSITFEWDGGSASYSQSDTPYSEALTFWFVPERYSEGIIVRNIQIPQGLTSEEKIFDIGTSENPFRDLFLSGTLTLGSSSLQNEGYIHLAENLILQWTRLDWNGTIASPPSYTEFNVTFPSALSTVYAIGIDPCTGYQPFITCHFYGETNGDHLLRASVHAAMSCSITCSSTTGYIYAWRIGC